jgi:hypothetical protein
MDGIVERLLQLESAKHGALMACDSAAYEGLVKAQVGLLNSGCDLKVAAQQSRERVEVLARLIRLNTNLMLNHFSASPVFAANGALGRSEYTSQGTLDARPEAKFSVDV